MESFNYVGVLSVMGKLPLAFVSKDEAKVVRESILNLINNSY
jgi:hypothetical protein